MGSLHRILVWDLPVRLLHWLLAGGFALAAAIALVLGDDSPLFPYHAIIGLAIILMVLLRVIWGFVGTRHAQFASFAFGPQAVVRYLKKAFLGKTTIYTGHNPGSAWAIIAMLSLLGGLAITGIMLGLGIGEVKDLHVYIAYAMIAAVSAHLLGVLLHAIRHRENITASMIHGYKAAQTEESISSTQPLMAGSFVVFVVAWTIGLLANYDSGTQSTQLPVLGTRLDLSGEAHDGNSDQPSKSHDEDDE